MPCQPSTFSGQFLGTGRISGEASRHPLEAFRGKLFCLFAFRSSLLVQGKEAGRLSCGVPIFSGQRAQKCFSSSSAAK